MLQRSSFILILLAIIDIRVNSLCSQTQDTCEPGCYWDGGAESCGKGCGNLYDCQSTGQGYQSGWDLDRYPCIAGTYAPLEENTECTVCSPGTYQPEPIQASCISCPLGTYQTSYSSNSCIACPSGTYNDQLEQSSCQACSTEIYSGEGAEAYALDDEGNKICLQNAGFMPTTSPSQHPSVEPSTQPSLMPTENPSSQPSLFPTIQPSLVPIEAPSLQPTLLSTTQPSVKPSQVPSTIPTQVSSSLPTLFSSTNPSSIPSIFPSQTPTGLPSLVPSSEPTENPTLIPSSQPSAFPSTIPSRLSSVLSSSFPSWHPSSQLTSLPSLIPSSIPSSPPSFQSSVNPSKTPSSHPSVLPSSTISFVPSQMPSLFMSSHPSSFRLSPPPSSNPTMLPSQMPTTVISSNPPSALAVTSPSLSPSFLNLSVEQSSSNSTSFPSHLPTSVLSFSPSSFPLTSFVSAPPSSLTTISSPPFSNPSPFHPTPYPSSSLSQSPSLSVSSTNGSMYPTKMGPTPNTTHRQFLTSERQCPKEGYTGISCHQCCDTNHHRIMTMDDSTTAVWNADCVLEEEEDLEEEDSVRPTLVYYFHPRVGLSKCLPCPSYPLLRWIGYSSALFFGILCLIQLSWYHPILGRLILECLDYGQILSLFRNGIIPWPLWVQTIFGSCAVWNWEIGGTALECVIPISYEWQWSCRMMMPIVMYIGSGIYYLGIGGVMMPRGRQLLRLLGSGPSPSPSEILPPVRRLRLTHWRMVCGYVGYIKIITSCWEVWDCTTVTSLSPWFHWECPTSPTTNLIFVYGAIIGFVGYGIVIPLYYGRRYVHVPEDGYMLLRLWKKWILVICFMSFRNTPIIQMSVIGLVLSLGYILPSRVCRIEFLSPSSSQLNHNRNTNETLNENDNENNNEQEQEHRRWSDVEAERRSNPPWTIPVDPIRTTKMIKIIKSSLEFSLMGICGCGILLSILGEEEEESPSMVFSILPILLIFLFLLPLGMMGMMLIRMLILLLMKRRVWRVLGSWTKYGGTDVWVSILRRSIDRYSWRRPAVGESRGVC